MATVGSYGGGGGYERGAPEVHPARDCVPGRVHVQPMPHAQGYLAHKKLPPARTLQQAYTLGPMVVLRRGAVSCERGIPADKCRTSALLGVAKIQLALYGSSLQKSNIKKKEV